MGKFTLVIKNIIKGCLSYYACIENVESCQYDNWDLVIEGFLYIDVTLKANPI